jgi:anaerobic ribonucleoside-triphosphate reductase
MLGKNNSNVPIKCNKCHYLYYVDPSKSNDPCEICGANDVEQISETDAMNHVRAALRL